MWLPRQQNNKRMARLDIASQQCAAGSYRCGRMLRDTQLRSFPRSCYFLQAVLTATQIFVEQGLVSILQVLALFAAAKRKTPFLWSFNLNDKKLLFVVNQYVVSELFFFAVLALSVHGSFDTYRPKRSRYFPAISGSFSKQLPQGLG